MKKKEKEQIDKKELSDTQLNQLSDYVINTVGFYGIKLVKIDINTSIPSVYINIYTKKLKKSLNETLNIAYWVFWSFIYGEYSIEKAQTSKIILNYSEV